MLGLGLGIHTNTFTKKLLPLDSYENNLVAGFSYFKLLTSYTGNCVRIRRSNDNEEQDFGFVSDYVDYSSILTFCGSNTGYIVKMYNQYTSGNDISQSTNENQPIACQAGVFYTNGYLNTTDTALRCNTYSAIDFENNNFTIVAVASINDSGVTRYILSKNLDNLSKYQYGLSVVDDEVSIRIRSGTVRATTTFTQSQYVFIQGRTNGTVGLSVDGGTEATGSYDSTFIQRDYLVIGARDNTDATLSGNLDGSIRTILIFNTYLNVTNLRGKV